MARTQRAALAASAVLLLTLARSAAAAQPPRFNVEFNGKTITATGATPRGEVIFFGEAQEPGEYTMLTYSHYERFGNADASGMARVELATDIVTTSVWAVVDIASGNYVVTPPAGGAKKSKSAPGGLLRPGVGAWEASAAEAGEADEKGHGRGRIVTPIPALHAVRDPNLKPISTLQGGDVVVIIEPQYLFFYATQVNGK
jgi:hypothetical protein